MMKSAILGLMACLCCLTQPSTEEPQPTSAPAETTAKPLSSTIRAVLRPARTTLPVGGQVIAPRFGEPAMFRIAYALESELGGAAHA